MKDISNKEDINLLMDEFYTRVRKDELLSPVFKTRIPNDASWPAHMEVISLFWESVLLGETPFRGNPFPKHVGLGISSIHFDRWMDLFHTTIDELFSGKIATEAKQKSVKMRTLFEFKLNLIDETGMRPLV